jgi:predicted nucleic acid-binding protein
MILVDSSVFIDAVRKRDRLLLGHFDRYDAAVCGAVRAEILCGVRSPADEVRFVTALDSLFQLPTLEETWAMPG